MEEKSDTIKYKSFRHILSSAGSITNLTEARQKQKEGSKEERTVTRQRGR